MAEGSKYVSNEAKMNTGVRRKREGVLYFTRPVESNGDNNFNVTSNNK